MSRCCLIWSLTGVLFSCLSLFAGNGETETDQKARRVVEKALQAIQTNDLNAMMEVLDVPYFHDNVKVIKKKEELKEIFRELFEERKKKKSPILPAKINEVLPYDKAIGRFNKKARKMIEEVLTKDDRVVFGEARDRGRVHKFSMMVRIRNGTLKLVGLLD